MKRSNIEKVMESISIVASILMGVVAIYKSYKSIREDTKKLISRSKNNEGS